MRSRQPTSRVVVIGLSFPFSPPPNFTHDHSLSSHEDGGMCSLVPAVSYTPARFQYFRVLLRRMAASTYAPRQVINSMEPPLRRHTEEGVSGASHTARSAFAEYRARVEHWNTYTSGLELIQDARLAAPSYF